MANLVVHFEIHASEPERLIEFYSQLFGWSFTQFGEMPYWSIDTGEGSVTADAPGQGINGGLTQRPQPRPEPGAPVNGCDFVVGVEPGTVDELFQKGLDLGATEAMAVGDVPGIGRFGYLLDPDNNVFGILTPVLSDGTVAMGGAVTSSKRPS